MQKKVQSYELLDIIGHGGMGVVYKARHEFSEEIVAVKALAHQYAFDQELRKRFRNEALILRKLKHENIVLVKDYIEEQDCLYIIMEFVAGRTLEKMIGKEVGPIVAPNALPIFMQILRGIEFAHNNGVIHRDIKPGNIIVTPDNRVKITDFGIAKMEGLSNLSATGAKMGTLCYMSPEQFNGETVDMLTDVYSLGMTLYEMLAGRLPFNKDDKVSDYVLISKILNESIPDPRTYYPHIPAGLVDIVFSSLEKDKQKRLQSVSAFIQRLENRVNTGSHSVVLENNNTPAEIGDGAAHKREGVAETNDVTQSINNVPENNGTVEAAADKLPPERREQWKSAPVRPGSSKYWLKASAAAVVGILLIVYAVFSSTNNKSSDTRSKIDTLAHKSGSPKVKDSAQFTAIKRQPFEPELVPVEGGSFMMGNKNGYSSQKPVHKVTLSTFQIGKYEVTQKEWRAVMKSNPSQTVGDNLPVTNVNFSNIQKYLAKLNSLTGRNYRLPTEAEWEYAARGGNRSKGFIYAGGNKLSEVAWWDRNSNNKVHPVGTKKPNELGIYDMSGNVSEWTNDWYASDYYSRSPEFNPQGPAGGKAKTIRCGCYYNEVEDIEFPSYRYGWAEPSGSAGPGEGFRVVLPGPAAGSQH